ncbi:MAG: pilC, partial [Phycisphaerales bacterium]|nr:pilC [Phycisphaerales bacterium]
MPTYRFETSGAGGKVTAGAIQAASLAAASQQLRARGDVILSLTRGEAAGARRKGGLSFSFGPSGKDVANFTSQLAVMIRAGISIRSAIEGISEQAENPKFRAILIQMKKDVEG